jgi:choline dehydrogenase-like flavoprotein
LSSRDPFDPPVIDPQLLNTNFDIFVLKEAVRSSRRFVTASAWKDYVVAPFSDQANITTDADLESYIRNTSSSEFHPVGTASMSPLRAPWGVVDPDLKVKGVTGLRIVDASIFVSIRLSIVCQP